MPRREPPPAGRSGRPYVVPPALLRSGEPFDGHHVLDEVRSPLGVVLWEGVRDVVLWATTAPTNRPRLFGRRAHEERVAALHAVELDPDARGMLVLLAGVLDAEKQPDRQSVARACRKLAFWAEERLLPRTSIWYAQAAALASPESAEHAYTVGLLCRRNADYIRAETWYRRAIGLARRRRDAQVYARAHIGLGDLWMQLSDYRRARLAFERAYKTARRAGIRTLRAEALHELFTVAVETNTVADAETYAQKAFRACPLAHELLPRLAHDVAVFWMLQGFYARALPVFQAVLGTMTRPNDRLMVLSSIARAAGGAGRLDLFANAWVDTWQIIDDCPTLECVTSSLVNLARGSASLGDWERVELAARHAFELAGARNQTTVQQDANALLEAAERHDFAEQCLPPVEELTILESAEHLADALVRRLTRYAGTP
jgi:tetratricopeptide (TPR) repeat protein